MTELTHEQHVTQDLQDDNDNPVSSDVVKAIAHIARLIPDYAPEMKVAAFSDENGGASLVVHKINRQVTFIVTASGELDLVCCIDEAMKARSYPITSDTVIRTHLEWMTNDD